MVFKLILHHIEELTVWEWCKYVWYSNNINSVLKKRRVWEWCKYVWYSNWSKWREKLFAFENDVNMYGIQTAKARFGAAIVFENDVNMYGIQTELLESTYFSQFENDVNMYGIQTINLCNDWRKLFENDVNMYGIQTCLYGYNFKPRLRMM